jgi:tripartite ATP-independent transporter DctM subunit
MLTLVLFGGMLFLFCLRVPIPFSLGLAASAALLLMPRMSFEIIVQRMFYGLDSFIILSAPLFILLGELMEAARITDRLVDFAQALVGRFRGGLGHVAIVSNMVMAGISGSGTADAAATGGVLVPAMSKAGYTVPFSAAVVGSAATIGPIIPPSIIMVIYASIANVSIARMFLGGILPGMVMGGCLMALTAWRAHQGKLPRGVQASAGEVVKASGRASLVLLTPLIVIVGIVGGAFTATESAAIACAYALLLGLAIYRTVRLKDLWTVFERAVWTTGRVMFVVALASGFSWILARGGVPAQLAQLPFFSGSAKRWMILLALNVILLILGCLMESIAILLIMTPMILPIAIHAGIDPIHLGVVMSVNLSIGLATPPFGTAMFVMCAIARCSIADFSREVWPFVGALVLALFLTTFVPELVLFLPSLLMGAK